MDKTIFKASEIRYLWRHRGSKNYELKCLKATGNFITSIIFEDIRNGRQVSGKLIASPREGEAYHWPRLQHENLAPLFDVVSINEKVSVYMSVILEKNLRDIIHEDEFLRAPNCFERKKSYVEDVLWGLDYLHDKRLCLMNLNDANVFIYNQTDKAVISDFSYLTLAARATKNNVAVPSLYRAPELNNSSDCFNAVAAEMWACGVMMLQVFTGHAMPETCSSDELLQRVANLHNSVLAEANRGSFITPNAFISFKSFLSSFLCLEPSERCTAKIAAVSSFLQKSRSTTDRRYGKLWEFYAPPTIYPPEEDESEGQNFCNPPKTQSCPNSREIDCYRDNLKIYFPWNKFINLNYVSNELNNSKSHNSSKINMQKDLNIYSETADKPIKHTRSLNFENAPSDQYISKSNETANQKFEKTNCAIETTRNNFRLEPDTNTNQLHNVTHFSSLVSSNVSDPSNNNDNLTKEISSPGPKHIEMKNQEAVISDKYLINLTSRGSCNELQDSDLEETNKLIPPLMHSTDNFVGMFKNEKSYRENECPSNIFESKNASNEYVLEATNKLSSVPSFSTGDSISAPRNESMWDKKEIYCNLLPAIQKSDSDSESDFEITQRYGSDIEIKSTNPPASESSWIKDHNQNSLPNAEKILRAKDNSLLQTGINKTPLYNFYKNRVREIRKSHSDSTISSSISHSFSVKSDPSNYSNRTWNSHTALFPEASKGGLIEFVDKGFERMYCAMNSINEEARTECSTFSEECSFSCTESELSDTLQKDYSEMNNLLIKDTHSPLNQGLLLSARSLTCHPAFSPNNQVKLSLLSNKSETYLDGRKNLLFTNYMSEMCLDVRKRAAIFQKESSNKNTKFCSDGTIKVDLELFDIEKNFKNATNKIGYNILGSDNAGYLDAETDFCKCSKRDSHAYTMMERSDSNVECGNVGFFPYEGISRPDGITEKQTIRLASTPRKFQNKEKEMSEGDIQADTKDASLKFEDVDGEKACENSLQNLELDKDEEIIEMRAESYSFTEISLNSTQEPDTKPQQNKSKKKEKRRKSWFHRLCLGCKVYYDDKEELFAGT